MFLLGQGHRDAQTFVPKELSEPSLAPPSSGADAVDLHDQQLKLFPPGNTRKSWHSCGWCCWWWCWSPSCTPDDDTYFLFAQTTARLLTGALLPQSRTSISATLQGDPSSSPPCWSTVCTAHVEEGHITARASVAEPRDTAVQVVRNRFQGTGSSAKTVGACFTSIVASSHDHDCPTCFKLISRQIYRIVPHVVAATGYIHLEDQTLR